MIRAIRPSAVARADASIITGWNIAPNVGYMVTLSATASAVVVILASADGATLIGSGVALVGTDQPVTITPVTGQTISMVDADLGWHLLVTASGTEGERSIVMDPMVDLADEIHPIYTDDGMALARATAAINSGASYVDDVSVNCPLGIGAGLGAVASVPVDGVAVVGQVESVTWSGTPDGTIETAVIRRHTAIAPAAYTPPPAPPVLVDDTAETDASTATSGNVLANDTGTLTVVAVNGLSANVGEEIAGSAGGVFTIAEDGAWTFDPDGDFASLSGSDTATTSVSYHASNGQAEASATLMLTVSSADAVLWTPAEITTALWLDAADSSTITLNGSTVSQWSDKSGNERHVSQSSAEYQPILSANSIVFSGDYLASPALSLNINGYGIAAVYAASTTGSTYAGFINLRSSNFEDPELRFGISGNIRCYADYAYKINVDAGVTTKNISVVYFSPTETALYKNGTSVVSSTASALSNVVSIKVGHYDAASSKFSGTRNGTANEIVIYPQSLVNRQRIEGYLTHKWDGLLGVTTLVDALPSDHPYKSAAPTL